ncbi:hypothetical protein M3Y94_01089400 [Aphelenchoides besseyi]|nr:hypothetical protein M3Y94_01089400 [Aphelenchoides besseyi]KAI6221731.1 hypothetical protein M3Y95_00993000 [Aphelenchoides besseyi]
MTIKNRIWKLIRMLFILFLLLLISLFLYSRFSNLLGPYTKCTEKDDVNCIRTLLVWSTIIIVLLFAFCCAGISIFVVDEVMACACFDEGHVLRAIAAILVVSFIFVLVFFTHGAFQFGREVAKLLLGEAK